MKTFHITSRRPLKLALAALTAIALSSFATSSAAAGTQIISTSSQASLQSWVDGAKAPTPTSKVKVEWRSCNLEIAAVGCASYDPLTATGTIALMPGMTGTAVQKIFFHELGHVFDMRHLFAPDRAAVTSLLGFPPGTPWVGAIGQPAPNEWFAEAASLCYTGYRYDSLITYRFPFSFDSPQVQGTCALMAKAIKQRARETVSFVVTLPPLKKLESVSSFDPGTISATVTLDGKTLRSNSSCTDQIKAPSGSVFINTCGTRVVAWSYSSMKATVLIRGVTTVGTPLGSTARFSAITNARAKKILKKRWRR